MGLRLGRPHIYGNTLQMTVHKLWHVHTGCVLTGRAKLAGANRPSRAEPAGGRLEPHAELAAPCRVWWRPVKHNSSSKFLRLHPVRVIHDSERVCLAVVGHLDSQVSRVSFEFVCTNEFCSIVVVALSRVVHELSNGVPRLIAQPPVGCIHADSWSNVDR